MHARNTKENPRSTAIACLNELCIMYYAIEIGIQHRIVENSTDALPSYLPDSHHSSDTVYWGADKFLESVLTHDHG